MEITGRYNKQIQINGTSIQYTVVHTEGNVVSTSHLTLYRFDRVMTRSLLAFSAPQVGSITHTQINQTRVNVPITLSIMFKWKTRILDFFLHLTLGYVSESYVEVAVGNCMFLLNDYIIFQRSIITNFSYINREYLLLLYCSYYY